MDKTLQDIAWSVLPKEFKEEVKYEYRRVATKVIKSNYDLGFMNAHEGRFGIHNLTSDAEGEEDEMLYVSRKQVQEMYADVINDIRDYNGENPEMVGTTDPILRERAAGMKAQLRRLFGSKCLPDVPSSESRDCDNPLADKDGCRWRNDGKCAFNNACYFEPLNPREPKTAEPKFKKGDMVHCKSFGYEGDYKVLEYTGGPRNCYDCIDKYGAYYRFYESDLEPYTEPTAKNPKETAETFASDEPTTTESDDFDNIVKDSFRSHNRLHIATQITASIYSNHEAAKQFRSIEAIVRKALDIADTLIAECELSPQPSYSAQKGACK